MKKAFLVPILALAATPAFAVVTTFTAIHDSILIAGGVDDTGSFGGRAELIGGDASGNGRDMIMRWDVSSLLSTVGTVNSMTIELDLLAAGRAAPTLAQTASVKLISETDKDWTEGSGVNNVTQNDGVAFNHKNGPTNDPWSGGAGLIGSATVATVGTLNIAGTESQGDTLSVTLSGTDLTALIAGWADDGISSSGLFFEDDSNQGQQVFFVSKETGAANAGAGTAARLIVDYDPIPEPSATLFGLFGAALMFRRRR